VHSVQHGGLVARRLRAQDAAHGTLEVAHPDAAAQRRLAVLVDAVGNAERQRRHLVGAVVHLALLARLVEVEADGFVCAHHRHLCKGELF